MELTIKQLFLISIHYLTIGWLLRSMFYLLKARGKMKNLDFYFLIIPVLCGILYLSYNANDMTDVGKRFPIMTTFIAGAANAFYMLSRSTKEHAFSIQNFINDNYSIVNLKTLSKLAKSNNNEVKIGEVYFNDLKNFDINKLFYVDKIKKKEGIIRYKVPFKDVIMFSAFLLKDGVFGLQVHPDADETLYIIEGEALELNTGIIYKEGDSISIPAGETHGLKGLTEICQMRAYLKKI